MALGQLPVEFRVGDVRDATALRSSLSGCGAVVHLAAIADREEERDLPRVEHRRDRAPHLGGASRERVSG